MAALAADAPSGPYLRLDSGFSWARDPGLNTTGTSPFFAGVMVNTTGDSLGNSFVFGGGAGYRINSMFRADFTLGYRGGYDLEGSGIGV
ncbi:MAG TPA: hypothetical protein VEU47_01910, partial [Candidatus Cybelea sp.]|nr:hypothetical protein [Candidatus Cybelea sp.]